jgi:hypothetical protein
VLGIAGAFSAEVAGSGYDQAGIPEQRGDVDGYVVV